MTPYGQTCHCGYRPFLGQDCPDHPPARCQHCECRGGAHLLWCPVVNKRDPRPLGATQHERSWPAMTVRGHVMNPDELAARYQRAPRVSPAWLHWTAVATTTALIAAILGHTPAAIIAAAVAVLTAVVGWLPPDPPRDDR